MAEATEVVQLNTDRRSISVREVIYVRGHGRCFYCGQKVSRAEMTLDHLVPLHRGGAHLLSNVVASCQPCNSAKGALLLAEYRRVCGGQPFPGEGIVA